MNYEAFLSYSHAADGQLAPKLEQSLKRFGRWFWQSSMPVFRDETTLALTPHLWPVIKNKIDESGSFILLASPDAAKSKWVDMEVRYWLETRGPDRLFIVVTSGTVHWDQQANDFDWTVTDALPPSLKGALPNEPKWENVTAVKTSGDVSGGNPVFDKAVASLYSAITGRPLEDVIGVDVRRKQQNRALVGAGIAVTVISIVGAIGHTLYNNARSAREQANQDRHNATVALARKWLAVDDPNAAAATLVEGLSKLTVTSKDGAKYDEVVRTLTEALHASRETAIARADVELRHVAVSRDGRWMAAAGDTSVMLLDPGVPSIKAQLDVGAKIQWIGFSHDSSKLFAWSSDRMVRQWTLGEAAVATGPSTFRTGDNVTQALFDATGGRIVTLDATGTACIDQADQAASQCTVRLNAERPISDLAWMADGTAIAGVHRDGSVAVWDATTGALIGQIPIDPPTPDFDWKIVANLKSRYAMAWVEYNDANKGPEKTKGALFDLSKRTLVGRITFDSPRWIGGAAFSPDGAQLAVRTRDRAQLVDLETGKARAHIVGHTGYIRDLVFSPDSALVATASYDRSVRIWDAATGAGLQTFMAHQNRVNGLSFSADGCTLASVSLDKTLRVWSVAAGAWHRRLSEVPCDGRPRDPSGSLGSLNSGSFSRDGTFLATASADGKARVWDTRAGSLVQTLDRTVNVLAADFDPSGRYLALGEGSTVASRKPSELSIIEWRTGRVVGSVEVKGRARTAKFSPDGRHALAASGDGTARVFRFDEATGLKEERLLRHGSKPVTSASWNPDGRRIVTTSDDKKVCIWRIEADQAIEPVPDCRTLSWIVYDATWSHAGDAFATVDGDATIRIYSGEGLAKESKFKLLDDRFGVQVAFTPDDKQLVIRLNDGSLLIRDIALGRDVYELPSPVLRTTGFAVAQNGRELATVHSDGSARLLPLFSTLDDVVKVAREGLPRCLTPDQRQRYGMPWAADDRLEWCQTKWPADTKARVFRVLGRQPTP
jgi:WD40 repeat protein